MKKHHHEKHETKPGQSRKGHPLKHLFKVFILYLAIAAAVAGWIDYSSYAVFNPLWMLLAALATAMLATAVHWYSGRHNRVDDIAEGDL